MKKDSEFKQGYACAVVTLIQLERGVETQTRELFRAGFGSYNLEALKSAGIDEFDLSILKKYRKEL
jgi:hypothetical protein